MLMQYWSVSRYLQGAGSISSGTFSRSETIAGISIHWLNRHSLPAWNKNLVKGEDGFLAIIAGLY